MKKKAKKVRNIRRTPIDGKKMVRGDGLAKKSFDNPIVVS